MSSSTSSSSRTKQQQGHKPIFSESLYNSSSAWIEDESSEFTTVSGWNGSQYPLQSLVAATPKVQQAMHHLAHFYQLQQAAAVTNTTNDSRTGKRHTNKDKTTTPTPSTTSSTQEHDAFYHAFQQAFDKHATALVYPYGTSVSVMTTSQTSTPTNTTTKDDQRQAYASADELYFDFYRPYLTLHHGIQITQMTELHNNNNNTADNDQPPPTTIVATESLNPVQEEEEALSSPPPLEPLAPPSKGDEPAEAPSDPPTTTKDKDNNDNKDDNDVSDNSAFTFVTQSDYAGKTLTIQYTCRVRNGKILYLEQGETTISAHAPQTIQSLTTNNDKDDDPNHNQNDSKTTKDGKSPRRNPLKKLWTRVQKFSNGAA